MFERYTEKARRVIFFARYEASQFGSPYIETEHLLLGVIREDKGLSNRFLHSRAATIREQIENQTTVGHSIATSVDLPLSNECKRVLAYAAEEAERLADKHIGSEHLFLGLLREEKGFAAQILMERGVRLSKVREELARQTQEATQVQSWHAVHGELQPYLSDLADQTQPLIGREQELDRLTELLCHFTPKNPVLVGERGVGKRTIVGGLARRIADGNTPQSLKEKTLVVLDLPPLRVLEKDASWHDELDQALAATADEGTIFFVNQMHDRRGGIAPLSSIHVTELLQRSIMAGKIQCIGTSTPASFAKLKGEAHWLAEYFEPIQIAPASEESAIAVLHGIKETYQKFHNVTYTDDAITRAVVSARKYIKTRSLPGAAVDVIDEAGAAAQLQQGSLPDEIMDAQKRIRFIVQRMEAAIASHEFEKARFYSDEERKERLNLKELRNKHKLGNSPPLTVTHEEIERVVSRLLDTPEDLSSTSA